jgi:hypothetical protein
VAWTSEGEMGAWGVELFEDDMAEDTRLFYEELLGKGLSPAQAAEHVLNNSQELVRDLNDGPVLFLILASLLLDNGVQDHHVFHEAKLIIERGLGLDRWIDSGEDLFSRRQAVYKQLYDRIQSIQPPLNKYKKSKPPKIGDVLKIPLPDGRSAYGHYIFNDPQKGPLVQIFDLITNRHVEIEELIDSKPLFPPIVTGIKHAVRSGRWKVIGNYPVTNFQYPKFLMGVADSNGNVNTWWLWNGQKEICLGSNPIPDEYKSLELLWGWSLEKIEQRIQTGSDPLLEKIKKVNFT